MIPITVNVIGLVWCKGRDDSSNHEHDYTILHFIRFLLHIEVVVVVVVVAVAVAVAVAVEDVIH